MDRSHQSFSFTLFETFGIKKLTLIISTCKPAKLNSGKAFFLKLSKALAQFASTKTVTRRKRSPKANGTSPNCFASLAYTARISQSLKNRFSLYRYKYGIQMISTEKYIPGRQSLIDLKNFFLA